MTEKILNQGAEAIISQKGNEIIKRRIEKSYRLKQIDEKIRKLRTRSEAKLLERAGRVIPVPKVLKVDEAKKEIVMESLKGEKLSSCLDKFSLEKQKEICEKIGENIAKIHGEDIVHGDLTTSNMILSEEKEKSNMSDNFKEQMSFVKKLNLPKSEYVVEGSGPIAVRGLRENHDIDMVVKEKLWNKLAKEYPIEKNKLGHRGIRIGFIEVYKDWKPWFEDTNTLIDDADIFDGIKFVKLKYSLELKKRYGRKKDLEDIELIKDYLKKIGNNLKIYFIDFGLGFISSKVEDKAVDLHLLREAFEAGFAKNWEMMFDAVKEGYSKDYKDSHLVLERFKAVEKRGRYKQGS